MSIRSLTRSFSKPKVSKEIASVSVQHLKEVKKDGFLWKRSSYNHWKKHFFVLTSVGIYIFSSQNATNCKGLIRFSTYAGASPAHSETKKPFSFQIHYYSAVDAKHQSTVFLMAENEADMNSWMDAIYSTLETAEKVTRQSYRFTPISAENTKSRKYRSLVISVAEAKELGMGSEMPPQMNLSTSSMNSSTSSLDGRSNSISEPSKPICNCYTMVDIGQEQYRTRTARTKTPNPFWGEDFTVDLEEDVEFNGVSFTVWCEDKNHRPYIAGRVSMDEEQLIANQLMNQWVYLDYASTAEFSSGFLTLRWTYGEPNLTVRILEGRNLAMKSAHGAIYVEASYLAQVHKTQVIRGTRNPFWNEELVFINPFSVPRAMTREFRVTCYDDSLPQRDGFLGEFVIPIERLNLSATKDVKFTLCPRVRASPNSSYSRRSAYGSELSRASSIRLSTRSSSSPNLRQNMLAAASAAQNSASPPGMGTISAGSTPTFVHATTNALISTSAGSVGSRSPLSSPEMGPADAPAGSGSIRLSVRYLVENILPSGSYRQLHRLLTSHDGIQMSIALGSMVLGITERTQVSTSLVRAYDALGESTTLIIALTTHEILSTEDPHVIFRGNFLGSKALDAYMRLIGGHYLHTTLSAFVTKLYEFGKSCELDPKALKPGKDLNRNIKRLQQITLDVLKAIYGSTEQCPSPLRTVFANLQRNVTHKFGDLKFRYLVVAGVLFSRLFCVALLSPKLFGLAQDHPDAKTERTLKLVVKIIQNIANSVVFEEKEEYMKCMNPFIQEHLPLMKNYIDSISKPTSYYTPSYNTTVINLDRESACIHAFLRAYKNELYNKFSQTSWIQSMINILKELDGT